MDSKFKNLSLIELYNCKPVQNLTQFARVTQELKVTDLVQKYKSLLAIAPRRYMVSNGTTHVNLFREILVQLIDIDTVTSTMAADESFLRVGDRVWVTVRDGKALRKWEEISY